MEDIIVGVIQMNAPCGRIEENLARHDALARKAAKRGAELICFPELSISGHYVDAAAWKCGEPVPGGPSCRAIEALARELNVFISAGIGERRGNATYNTQFLVGPGGYIGKYSKTHASGDEYFYFSMGAEFPVFDIGKCKVGMLVCYDIAFPEVARILALNGAEVILAPHASRCGQTKPAEERQRVMNMLKFYDRVGWARANDNGVFMIMNNQSGDAGKHLKLNIVHGGGMLVKGPDGETISRSRRRRFGEEVMIAELKAEDFVKNHARRCHPMQTRRPEIYGRIADTSGLLDRT